MNNRKKRNEEININKKVIRCKAHNKPVFEHEVFSQLIQELNSKN